MLQDGAHLDERAFVGQDQGQGRARVGLDFEDQAPVARDLVLVDALSGNAASPTQTLASSHLFFENLDDSIDLILTDYHMGDTNGEEIINRIRKIDYD